MAKKIGPWDVATAILGAWSGKQQRPSPSARDLKYMKAMTAYAETRLRLDGVQEALERASATDADFAEDARLPPGGQK